MISQRALKQIGYIVHFLAICHSTPFTWDTTSQKLGVTKSKGHLITWKLSIILPALYSAYCGFRVITEIDTKPRVYFDLILMLVWCLVYFWAFSIQINGLIKGEDMAWVFNQIVDMDKQFEKKSKEIESTKLIEKIIFVCTYMALLALICWGTIVYVASTSKAFLYGCLPVEMRGQAAFHFFLVFEIYSKWQAIANIIWDLLFITVKTIVTSHWIQCLKSYVKPLRLQIQEYKVMYVLTTYINFSHNAAKIPTTMGILLTLLVTSFYGLIQFFGKMGAATYLMFPIVVNNCLIISLLVLVPGAKLYKNSQIFFRKIRGVGAAGKVIRREAKCIRVFGIRLGFLRAIRYPHIANYFLALSNYTLSLLVAFPTFE